MSKKRRNQGTSRRDLLLSAVAIALPLAAACLAIIGGPTPQQFAERFTLEQCGLIFLFSWAGMIVLPVGFTILAFKSFMVLRYPLDYTITVALVMLASLSVPLCAWTAAACGNAIV